jgi:hypothetical protein
MAHPAASRALVSVGANNEQVKTMTLGVLRKLTSRVVAADHVEGQPGAPSLGEASGQPGPLRVGSTGGRGRRLGVSRLVHHHQHMDLAVEATREGVGSPQRPLGIVGTVVADQETAEGTTTPCEPSLLVVARGSNI